MKRVVVLGAGSGIGRATALALAQRGYALALAGRRAWTLEAVAAECRGAGAPEVLAVPTDAARAGDVQRLASRAQAEWGGFDGWVQSAGVMAYGSVERVPLEIQDAVWATNVGGVVHAARSALPVLRQVDGRLVVVGSLLGRVAVPDLDVYVTSKWAVSGLVGCLDLRERERGAARVLLVEPAAVDTPIYARAANYLGREGRPPWPVADSESVATAVVRALDGPARNRPTGVANRPIQWGWRHVRPVYDRVVGPAFRAAALDGDPKVGDPKVADRPGNVLAP